jgi:hypothetical protein
VFLGKNYLTYIKIIDPKYFLQKQATPTTKKTDKSQIIVVVKNAVKSGQHHLKETMESNKKQ